jgi:hypothetical protein
VHHLKLFALFSGPEIQHAVLLRKEAEQQGNFSSEWDPVSDPRHGNRCALSAWARFQKVYRLCPTWVELFEWTCARLPLRKVK